MRFSRKHTVTDPYVRTHTDFPRPARRITMDCRRRQEFTAR
ncbi:MAG TPA: hypothetical protein VFC00_40880 [Micromonosporaceae bacterium]|nr:hypothetical protein [Micromonosporaceae bacterium]